MTRKKLAPVTIRPATRDDLEKYYRTKKIQYTQTAFVGVVRGRLVGCGGVAYAEGRVIAFCDLKPSARRYKMSIVRAAYKVIKHVQETGVKIMYAEANPDEPGAERWLTSLGFEQTTVRGIYSWRN
jgi:hypothetical protein